MDLELKMWISRQFEFALYGSNEKFEHFFEQVLFRELCFDSVVIEKDASCQKKAKNKSLKEKCKIIRHIEKGMASKKACEKNRVPNNTIST